MSDSLKLGQIKQAALAAREKEKQIAIRTSTDDLIVHLRSQNGKLEREITRLLGVVGNQRNMAHMVASAVMAAPPFPRVPWKCPAKPGSPVIPVLKLSDWHIGEYINPKETEGFGGFDWATAQRRVSMLIDSFLSWVTTQRNGYKITECAVFCEGDYVSGDIHQELLVTNEFPLPVQTANAGLLLGEVGVRLAPHFDKITFFEVGADNHGRLQKKPQFKQKTQNSMSYLVHVIANAAMAKHKNIEVITSDGIKYLASVAGKKFLIEHGDTTKAWMGIPYYGLERTRAREATRRMQTDKGFDYQSIGHWHVPGWVSGNILMNGSLSGTTEFDHGCGRHSGPSQAAFLVHPTHGVFNFVPFKMP
jgi:hypothetical protein